MNASKIKNVAVAGDVDFSRRLKNAVEAISLMCEGLNEHPLIQLAALGECMDRLFTSCEDTETRCDLRRQVFATFRENARRCEQRLGNPAGAIPDYIDVVFDGPPGPTAPGFVEVEDRRGHGISVGEWMPRNGYWVLRIPHGDVWEHPL